MQQKSRNFKLTIAITSLVSMLCYFISYFKLDEFIKESIETLLDLGSLFEEDIGETLGEISETIFESDNILLLIAAVVFLIVVPVLMNLVAAILNFVDFGKKKAQKGVTIYTLVAAGYTLVTEAVFIVALAIAKNAMKEELGGFAELFGGFPISLGFGFYVQVIAVIATIVVSIMAVTAITSAKNDQGLTPNDVGLIGLSGMWQGAEFFNNSGETIVIGRDANQCDIIISQNAQNISRKHCAVRYDYDREDYIVVDYSTNGTYLGDGKKLALNVETHVPGGGIILLGDKANSFKLN